jgi:hypothetical protein
METNNKKQFTCECGKKYIHQSGLLKHQKQCAKSSINTSAFENDTNIELNEVSEKNKPVQEAEPESEQESEQELESELEPEHKNSQMNADRRFVMGLIQENQELKRIVLKQHEQLENQDERLLEIVKAFFTKIITSVHQTQS